MSLRDLGVFAPLADSHPLASGHECWKCREEFGPGSRVGLVPIETPDQAGSLTVEAKPVCATCKLCGVEIGTPDGRRIVSYIKSTDHFPVVTTDGMEWEDQEVSL